MTTLHKQKKAVARKKDYVKKKNIKNNLKGKGYCLKAGMGIIPKSRKHMPSPYEKK